MKLKVTKCLEEVGLSDKRNVVSKKLSGGQKRKLSLAMAIIGEPRVCWNVDIFGRTVCEMVHPMLSDGCLCLSVCYIGVLWPNS